MLRSRFLMKETVSARAHGRVNLIGEHTDYNGGWVLPTSIPQYTEVVVEKESQNKIRIISTKDPREGHKREFAYTLGEETHTHTWVDYLQGATKLLTENLQSKNEKLSGFTAYIHSTIPEGSGLSSSAALEMSFLKALREMFNFKMTDIEMARLGQRIENEFVGARVGIMDHMATNLAKEGEAIFLDTQTLIFQRIPLPMELMDLLVINSGISHRISDATGGYNKRRAECEEACTFLGIEQLRDATLEKLSQINLPTHLVRRVRHVVTENQRVKEAVVALNEKNMKKLGILFFESHASMRDDFEISIPEIDALVELCKEESDVYGARLTGGGFGGSIVVLTKKNKKNEIAKSVLAKYKEATGQEGKVLV
jgi:galactokinase